MTLRFIDCMGFAGGFSCGATQAGMTLVGKLENVGGFGVPLVEANRAFLGDNWQSQVGHPDTWEPVDAEVVVGTPPCSGFSSMTAGYEKAHGMHAPINQCMRDLMHYAAQVKPLVVAMESVGQAYTRGLPLMRQLAVMLSEESGLPYDVTHVMQNNWSTGGCTKRKRYFLVLHRIPFGVERYQLGDKLPTVGDAFADLIDQPLSWDPEPYVDGSGTWWSDGMRNSAGVVDGHETVHNGYAKRILDVTTGDKGVEWNHGETDVHVLRRYYERHGSLPESWQYMSGPDKDQTRESYLVSRGFNVGGFSKPRMWHWDEPGRVINGAGPHMVWHPNGRFITHRETARLLGFPDDWVVGTARKNSNLYQYWGKGTSVSPARWIATWIKNSIEGNPGSYTGDKLKDGEDRFIDVSNDWKPVWTKHLAEVAATTA